VHFGHLGLIVRFGRFGELSDLFVDQSQVRHPSNSEGGLLHERLDGVGTRLHQQQLGVLHNPHLRRQFGEAADCAGQENALLLLLVIYFPLFDISTRLALQELRGEGILVI